ncbi:MAG: DUF2085 domain-containing protein [Deltaproteobacteria bacterium]|nr:DUF2085 domain-containing protein [Deltaproteobacteria bacterium]
MGAPPAAGPPSNREAPSEQRLRASRQLLFFARLSFFLVGTLPWWLPFAEAYLPLGPVWLLVDLPFAAICHRLPDRTIELSGVAMPLCSRCAGIFAGLALGVLTCWPRLALRQARFALLGAGLLLVADIVTQDLGWHPMWHSTRLLTGALLGYVAAIALMSAIIRERKLDPG